MVQRCSHSIVGSQGVGFRLLQAELKSLGVSALRSTPGAYSGSWTTARRHRGEPCVRRLKAAFPNLVPVHKPVHASWLNQIEIYFSIGGLLTTAEELRAMNIHRGQVRPGATPRVLVLDTSGLTWGRGRQGGMLANARLDAGLLVCREHKLVVLQRAAFPVPRVKLQDTPGFGDKLRIAPGKSRCDLKRANRILVQPPPNGLVA